MADCTSWTAVETAARIRARQISVREVTEAHLARIARINPAINAIVEPVEDALATAARLDAAGLPDRPAPLHGVPVTVKINVDHAGYALSNGLPALKDHRAEADSALVANLKRGGAVIVGRTNTPEFSLRWFTSNPLHGQTRNPWSAGLTPGGSSGGAAAAAAACLGALAHGNDLGGSLRYPAYCCGIASIRPSMGRVPAVNPSQPEGRPGLTQTMSVQGPIARTVADLRAGLAVMSQRDARDPLWTAATDSGRPRGGPLTIGYVEGDYPGPVSSQVAEAMRKARAACAEIGARLQPIALPEPEATAQLWGDLLFTETEYSARAQFDAYGSPEIQGVLDAYAAHFHQLDVPGLLDGLRRRSLAQSAWSTLFDRVDAILLPTSLEPPFAAEQDFADTAAIPAMLRAQAPLYVVNLLGLPAVALPTHLDAGVPLGVQVVGPMQDDAFLLDIAEALEGALGTLWQQLPANGGPAATLSSSSP